MIRDPLSSRKVMVLAQHVDGIFQVAAYSMRLGVNLQQRPPGVGTSQAILAKDGLATDG